MVITDVCLLLLSAVTMIVYPSCPNFLYNFVPSLIISYYIIIANFLQGFRQNMCSNWFLWKRPKFHPMKKIDLWCFGIWGQMLKKCFNPFQSRLQRLTQRQKPIRSRISQDIFKILNLPKIDIENMSLNWLSIKLQDF